MATIIFGSGNLGRAIAAAIEAHDGVAPRLIGRPRSGRHHPADADRADVAFDASRGEAVASNVAVALAAGCRRFVIATTGWDADRIAVESALRDHGAAAVVAPNFSLGVTMFMRLVEAATGLFGPIDAFDPYVLEWHRRDKLDRPSGTAREIARRVVAGHPRKRGIAATSASPQPDELEVVSLRAGASPGMHVVGFDAVGETVELRLTARDRSAYAAGAVAAAAWLRAQPRSPGIHDFDEVVDDLLAMAARPDRSRLTGGGLPMAAAV
jgi:4-hydroxy-tetrahydrodipicolinate reductase